MKIIKTLISGSVALVVGSALAAGTPATVTATATTQVAAKPTATNSSFATQNDKVSYAIGMNLGENFKKQGVAVNADMIARGVEDAMVDGSKPLMTNDEINATMTQFQKDFIAKREAKMKELSDKNQQEGDAYLAKNKTAPGVVTLPSGVQYKSIQEGKGDSPSDNDSVTVNYEGKLINGTVFDSSYTRGKPVNFQVNQVIPGWTEVLKLMKPGATWEVVIPAKQAYGAMGVGGMIGPNQTLLFKINLVEVKKAVGSAGKTDAAKAVDKSKH